jgi:D-threo-aldose 1-dehydrogenase
MTTKHVGVARLGYGCAHFSPRLSDSEALSILEKALDCGISHFDTARMYGAGVAERMLGLLARRRRAEMFIVSKAGIVPRGRAARALGKAAALLPGLHDPGTFAFGQFASHQVRRSVETSLRELQTDYLDALMLHEAAPGDITDELKRLLGDLRQQGTVKRVGIATSAEHTAAIAPAHPDLCEIIQVIAPPIGAALPGGEFLVVHSVLGTRLTRFVARMRADADLARRFAADVGADGSDAEAAAQLFLHYEMARNHDGVVLCSSMHPRHIEQNAALLTAPLNVEQQAAFVRFLSSM